MLSKNNLVYDIIYNIETPLIGYCKRNEIKCLSGLEMLLFQGVLAFEKFTKKTAPIDIMRQALKESFKNNEKK
jgi:shikimate dehydrogenase